MVPLEGVGDYVDITLIVNPWQAIVACVVIFAVLIWPQLSARNAAKDIKKTLTENNGGSSVKDALDEIKRVQAKQGAAQVKMQKAQAVQGRKLDEHIEWSETYVKDTGDRLAALEDPPVGGTD